MARGGVTEAGRGKIAVFGALKWRPNRVRRHVGKEAPNTKCGIIGGGAEHHACVAENICGACHQKVAHIYLMR